MRTWLLLALLGLVLFISMRYREGADSTLAPAPTCSNGGTLTGNKCSAVGGVLGNPICASGYSFTPSSSGNGTCVQLSSDVIGGTLLDTCNKYWDGVIVSWAAGEKAATLDQKCMQYAPSWITPDMVNTIPSAATKAQAIIEKGQADKNKGALDAGKGYAASTGYAALLASVNDADNGVLPSAKDETNRKMDIEATRSTTGPVFESDGVFSGQSGTGQGTASSAAAGLTGGNQYGGTAGGTYDSNGNVPGSGAYGMWQGTKGTSTPPPGNNLPVNGPSWGGRGILSGSSSSLMSSRPAPTLYGPQAGKTGPGSGLQSGYPQTNSQNGQFGSSCTTGSNPNNAFAATSRCPGDQDLIPNPYLQSTTYSLANESQKTDPVPFLTDFSAFQS